MHKANVKTWFAISVLIVSFVLFSSSTVEAVKIEFDEQASSASASVAMSVYAGAESDTDTWQDPGIVYDHNMAIYTAVGGAWASGSASIHSDVNDAYSDEDGTMDEGRLFDFTYSHDFAAHPSWDDNIIPASFSVQLDAAGNLYWNFLPSNPNEKEGDPYTICLWDFYGVGTTSCNMIYQIGTSKEYWVGSQKLGPYHVGGCINWPGECIWSPSNDPTEDSNTLIVRLGDTIKLSYNVKAEGYSTSWFGDPSMWFGEPSILLRIRAHVEPLKMTLIDKGWVSKNNLLNTLQNRLDLSPEIEQEVQAHGIVKGACADGATQLVLECDWDMLFNSLEVPADTESPARFRLRVLSQYGEDNGRLIGEGLDDCNDGYDDTPRIKNCTFTQTWIAPPVFDSVLGSANHEKMRQIPIQIEIDRDGDGNYDYAFIEFINLKRGKEFMITFDDGPVPGNTEKIVNALKNIKVANGEPVRAGFFMVGCDSGCEDTGASRFLPDCIIPREGCGWLLPFEPDILRTKGSVQDNSEIVKYVDAAGHIIGNHTQHHMWFWWWPFFSAVNAEITACNNELQSALGKTPEKIFRPPYFVDNGAVRTAARKLGFQIIMGAGDNRGNAVDVSATLEWEDSGDMERAVSKIKETACDLIQKWRRDEPCVLVFHDISPITANNIAEIIRYLREDEGFTLVHFDPSRLPGSPPSLVQHASNTIHQSETVTHTVSLDSTVSTATFNVSWKGSDLDLVLYKPDGAKIDPNSDLLDPNIKYAERDTYEYYTISDPNSGDWIMEVIGVNVPPEGEKYTIRVEADTNLTLFAFADKPDYGLNEQVNIRAELANDENSVTGALVMARIQRPDGSIDNLTLYDDGTHGDKDPNDGFYANAYNNTSLRGSYEIAVSAIGELTGDQYERASSLTVMVGSIIYGNVDFGAYAVFADHWLAQNCTEPGWCDTADLDQSGEVDIFDMGVLADHWLEGAAP